MYTSRMCLFIISFSLFACSSAPVKDSTVKVISPAQAVVAAAEAAPYGVRGVFEMDIKGTGTLGGFIYLNSEKDYRDQRCLTLAIDPSAIPDFVQKYGADPGSYLKDKRVRVSGEAERVKIWFNSNGKRTESYYYQTHVLVTNSSQVEVL